MTTNNIKSVTSNIIVFVNNTSYKGIIIELQHPDCNLANNSQQACNSCYSNDFYDITKKGNPVKKNQFQSNKMDRESYINLWIELLNNKIASTVSNKIERDYRINNNKSYNPHIIDDMRQEVLKAIHIFTHKAKNPFNYHIVKNGNNKYFDNWNDLLWNISFKVAHKYFRNQVIIIPQTLNDYYQNRKTLDEELYFQGNIDDNYINKKTLVIPRYINGKLREILQAVIKGEKLDKETWRKTVMLCAKHGIKIMRINSRVGDTLCKLSSYDNYRMIPHSTKKQIFISSENGIDISYIDSIYYRKEIVINPKDLLLERKAISKIKLNKVLFDYEFRTKPINHHGIEKQVRYNYNIIVERYYNNSVLGNNIPQKENTCTDMILYNWKGEGIKESNKYRKIYDINPKIVINHESNLSRINGISTGMIDSNKINPISVKERNHIRISKRILAGQGKGKKSKVNMNY